MAEAEEIFEPEIYCMDASDTRRYRCKARKKERMENSRNGQEDSNPDKPPEKVKHKERSHKSRK